MEREGFEASESDEGFDLYKWQKGRRWSVRERRSNENVKRGDGLTTKNQIPVRLASKEPKRYDLLHDRSSEAADLFPTKIQD